jgi:four helix bundle protein
VTGDFFWGADPWFLSRKAIRDGLNIEYRLTNVESRIEGKDMKKYDLEQRFIDFAVCIIDISADLENSKAGNHVGGQLLRSGTSPALNYGEAQSAESRKDFVHKMKIVLKELRETLVGLKIIEQAHLLKSTHQLSTAN